MPDELWMEVREIVQETGIKIPKKKKCKKAKWLSEEALQIAVKRREAKGKGEKKLYTHLNAEFQRIARRDKKAFLSDHWKEIEENKLDIISFNLVTANCKLARVNIWGFLNQILLLNIILFFCWCGYFLRT